ncbi:MAG: AMP-binding protein [Rickettsiales bacterium]|nr:AMP-binding protein [Rickettsiales bacterium]
MFKDRFLRKKEFESYQDYLENAAPIVPENFNFAFDVLDVLAMEQPDARAILWADDKGNEKTFTFKELSEISNQAANALAARGIKKFDTVLLFLRRRWEYWVLMMALHKIGAIAIPSTNQLKAHDISYRLKMSHASAVIAFDDEYIINEIEAALADCHVSHKLSVAGSPAGWFDISEFWAGQEKTFERAPNKNSDPMVIYFTSGTTDMPKMVLHDYTYPLGHINTAVFWQRLQPGDLHFTLSESGWAKCSWGKMYGQWIAQACVFIYDFSGKFPAEELLRILSDYKITSFCAPPTVYKMLIRENMSRYDLSSISKADIAGEALNPEVFRIFHEIAGVKLHEGFGQTETCVMLFSNQWIEPKPGSMGMPAAGWDIRLIENGKEADVNEVGEIVVKIDEKRPTGLFRGYFENEKQNARTFRSGYYHTGDMAYKDKDGYYWFVGRKDDLIKSSGYRISPFEVESILLEHPAVKEVAITGVPDDLRGMLIKATIVLNKYFQGTDVLVREIQEHVKKTTAPYKYPRIIEFVETLPMTISGKIKRAVIRTLDFDKGKRKK